MGIVAVVVTVALLTCFAATIHIDARWLMGEYPWISLPSILFVFVLAFGWQFRKGRT
jgi:hypothetical protein